jgi:hypothetical protein
MLGDFNLICQESNKNSGAVDRNLMHRFMKSIELLGSQGNPINRKKIHMVKQTIQPNYVTILLHCSEGKMI